MMVMVVNGRAAGVKSLLPGNSRSIGRLMRQKFHPARLRRESPPSQGAPVSRQEHGVGFHKFGMGKYLLFIRMDRET